MQKPQLFLLVGYPGAGKTTVSKIIAKATGAEHIWADHERLKMFGQPTHSQSESKELYDHLNLETDRLLAQGRSIIFDTNFNFYDDRSHLRAIAKKHGANTTVVWITTPRDVAKQRAVHDQNLRNGYEFPLSDDDFERMASNLQPPEEAENVIKIDGSQIDSSVVKKLLHI
jgi:predicted kinase